MAQIWSLNEQLHSNTYFKFLTKKKIERDQRLQLYFQSD